MKIQPNVFGNLFLRFKLPILWIWTNFCTKSYSFYMLILVCLTLSKIEIHGLCRIC